MNIYTLVLEAAMKQPNVCAYTDRKRAVLEAKDIAKQYPLYVERYESGFLLYVHLDDAGSRIYIKECELIGGDSD